MRRRITPIAGGTCDDYGPGRHGSSWRGMHPEQLTMMGNNVATTGAGVFWPSSSLDSATLNTGSSVLTVCVSEIATAANDRLAAMWPIACMDAGKEILMNSSLDTGCTAERQSSAAFNMGTHMRQQPTCMPCCVALCSLNAGSALARLLTHPAKGRLLEAKQIGGSAVNQADDNVHSRHRPWEWKVVEDLLVPQVEADVQPVPVGSHRCISMVD